MNITALSRMISRHYRPLRLLFLWTADAVIIFSSIVVSIFLYTRVVDLSYGWPTIFAIFGILLGIHVAAFTLTRVYNVSFQYANMLLTVKLVIVQGVYLGLAFYLINSLYEGLWPALVAILQAVLSIAGTAFLRISWLIYRELLATKGKSYKQVVVYGAGETGKNLVLALRNHRSAGLGRQKIIGFLDDDPNLKGKIIYGYKVLGDLASLSRLLLKEEVNEVVVAIPSLNGDRIRALRDHCRSLNVPVRMIPSFYETYNMPGEEIISSIRDISFEDLLRRPKRGLPLEALEAHFRDKTVIVLGGGGSIGSELVSQLLRLYCRKVVVADSSELNLYQVGVRFRNYGSQLNIRLIDAKDRGSLGNLFAEVRPQIVFNAAAYKHVDLVESSPAVGVINNIASMKNAADVAHEFGCEQFVFVSSDKAVRPANVMGTTKRIGEIYVQSLDACSDTSMFAVRFGNVIGSSGSLIPNVVTSVQNGEPVRITHPDMTRYFMLVPEAISLILTSCLYAHGGETFVLDMGEPIKIVELVEDLINLLDESKEQDVTIEFIGPRPGEKMHEELYNEDIEDVERRDGFFICTSDAVGLDTINNSIEEILKAIQQNQVDVLPELLRRTISLSAAPTATRG